ncbi:MAG: ABC-2 family transporter protein [Candidatus Uhrbacteria bacterium]|nr:ABC-2 family transporter protein [Candidatus Uhrbacteria bacterium]
MNELLKEIRIASEIARGNIRAAMELRGAFAVQVFGMMLNNIAFVLIWIFFFQAFGNINGWSSTEVFAFQGVVAFAYGCSAAFFQGSHSLPTLVYNGSLDSYLLSPCSAYMRILTSGIKMSGVGDLLFGFVLIVAYIVMAHLSFLQGAMLLSLLIPASIIMTNVSLITSLSSFYINDATAFAQNLFEVFVSPSLYPSPLFPKALRFIFIFVLPSLAVGGLPIEAVKDYQWHWYAIIWALAGVWTFFAIKLLNISIRKYESGNMIGARV